MSTGYNRLKKHRHLKIPADKFTISRELSNVECQLENENDESSVGVPVEIIFDYISLHESTDIDNISDNYNDSSSNNDSHLSDLTYSSLDRGIGSPDYEYQSFQDSSCSDCISDQESDCFGTGADLSFRQKLQC